MTNETSHALSTIGAVVHSQMHAFAKCGFWRVITETILDSREIFA